LAAELVAEVIEDQEEVLVVTLVNSAVDNVSNRIDKDLKDRGLIPRVGYRVRTLHGLAHDIVRERPGLVSLAEDFQIIDEREAARILEDCCTGWLQTHAGILERYVKPDIEGTKLSWVERDPWPELMQDIAGAFIRRAKDQRIYPESLQSLLVDREQELPLAHMGAAIYASYQRALSYRGGVDFDDLIWRALDALRADPDYLERLQKRWAFILEDEAQDSSRLQEEILKTLAGEHGNWVRVGDANQAIFETFTTASPEYLRRFMKREDVTPLELPHSGRSCEEIINLANHLIDWVAQGHPEPDVRKALSTPHILPAPPGDSQPNPAAGPDGIRLIRQTFTAEEEIRRVADSLERWLRLPEHQQETVAVLVPRNERGFKVADELRGRGVKCLELLQSTASTRQTARLLGSVLSYLAEPASAGKLAEAFRASKREAKEHAEENQQVKRLSKMLRRCPRVEDYLWPQLGRDWMATLSKDEADALEMVDELAAFRELMRTWQQAVVLPIDQLILTLAQDLFEEPVDLALAYKLALLLRDVSHVHSEWGLTELTEELGIIARNQRKFMGLSQDDTAFDPNNYRGTVVVTTMHKAKGLEWDRVYLMSVNNYDFPSVQSYDTYIAERWFIRDNLNLQAECLSQLDAARTGGPYTEGQATYQARLDYVAERLRLLYVGITRARKELIVTWNTGQATKDGRRAQQAVPFIALHAYWEAQLAHQGSTEIGEGAGDR